MEWPQNRGRRLRGTPARPVSCEGREVLRKTTRPETAIPTLPTFSWGHLRQATSLCHLTREVRECRAHRVILRTWWRNPGLPTDASGALCAHARTRVIPRHHLPVLDACLVASPLHDSAHVAAKPWITYCGCSSLVSCHLADLDACIGTVETSLRGLLQDATGVRLSKL